MHICKHTDLILLSAQVRMVLWDLHVSEVQLQCHYFELFHCQFAFPNIKRSGYNYQNTLQHNCLKGSNFMNYQLQKKIASH